MQQQPKPNFVEGQQVCDYRFEKLLGRGTFGEVWRVMDTLNGKNYAAKYYDKQALRIFCGTEASYQKTMACIENEVEVLTKIKHPNLLECYSRTDYGKGFILILQYCDGGTIEDLIKGKDAPLAESYVSNFMVQCVELFLHLEKHNVMHRDLKLENILRDSDGKVVVADFGLSMINRAKTSTVCGTPITMAPEVRCSTVDSKGYSNKVDVWSLGICFYMMLYGCDPFNRIWYLKNSNKLAVERNMYNSSGPMLHFPAYVEVSEDLKNLLKSMIHASTESRFDWQQVYNHRFMVRSRSLTGSKMQAVMKTPPAAAMIAQNSMTLMFANAPKKVQTSYIAYIRAFSGFTRDITEQIEAVGGMTDLLFLKKPFKVVHCYISKIRLQLLRRLNSILNFYDPLVDPSEFLKEELGKQTQKGVEAAEPAVTKSVADSIVELDSELKATPDKIKMMESLKKPNIDIVDLHQVHRMLYLITLALSGIWEKEPNHVLSGIELKTILKMAIVQICLCLTYQQAMEFKDDESLITELENRISQVKDPSSVETEYQNATKYLKDLNDQLEGKTA